MSNWREYIEVHPAADVFPMMPDDELAALGEDIKKNGQTVPIIRWNDMLLDGRNRMEAMERIGIVDQAQLVTVDCDDPVAYVIGLNIHRRHLTKQQQADLIVAAVKASRQFGEVPKRHVKGKAGSEKDAIKEAAVAAAAEHGISKRTVERALSDDQKDRRELRAYTKAYPVRHALTLIRNMTPAQRKQFDVEYAVWCERTGIKRTQSPNRIGKVIGLIANPNAGERSAAIDTANRLLEPMGMKLVVRK